MTAKDQIIEVILVDDHAIFAQALADSLTVEADIDVVAVVNRPADLLPATRRHPKAVALVDLTFPDGDGIDLTRQVVKEAPATRVVILTGNPDPATFFDAMGAGASGYLLKEATRQEVVNGIRRASSGAVVVPQQAAGLFERASAPRSGIGSDLTQRELDVLGLLGEGCDVRAISTVLKLSLQTTRSYIRDILAKLGAHSQLQAVVIANRLGILRSITRE